MEDDFIEDEIPEGVDEDDDGEDLLGDGFEKYVIPLMYYMLPCILVIIYPTTNLIAMTSVSLTRLHTVTILWPV